MVAKILEGDLKPEGGEGRMFFRKDRFSFRNPDPAGGDGGDKYVHYRLGDVAELSWFAEEPSEEARGSAAGSVGALVGLLVGLLAGAGLLGSLGLGAAGFVLGLVTSRLGKALRWGSVGPKTKIVFGIEFQDGKRVRAETTPKGWDELAAAHGRLGRQGR